jgi:hypothetical protein
MKKPVLIIFTFLLVLLYTPSVFAQQEGNQLYYAMKHSVKPEKIDEYKELMKKYTSACKEYNFPVGVSAWQSAFPDFYYFYRIDDYNAVEQLRSEQWKIEKKIGSDYVKKIFETIESFDDFFIRGIDSLSYNPTTNVDGLDYAEWWVHYHKTWKRRIYINAFKQANDIHKKSNYEYPIATFKGDIGMNRPAIITVFWAKNPADLYAHTGKAWESLGEEVQTMINDFSSTTRKFEKIPFWRQKDLSYTPE